MLDVGHGGRSLVNRSYDVEGQTAVPHHLPPARTRSTSPLRLPTSHSSFKKEVIENVRTLRAPIQSS